MVGYLKPNFKKMTDSQKKEYKSFYCGLCKALKKEYEYIGISCLNYEVTSFLLLLQGLEENRNAVFHGSCTISPFVPVPYVDYHEEKFSYASSISVLVAFFEIKDNLIDEGGVKWKLAEKFLSKKISKSANLLKQNFCNIEKLLNEYYEKEYVNSSQFYTLVKANGDLVEAFLRPLINTCDDELTFLLSKLANLLGQWIYLVDACDDFALDIKKNKFNPILKIDNKSNIFYIIESIETGICEIVKNLPLKNYKNIIEFIYIENLKDVSYKVLLKNQKAMHIKLPDSN